MAMRGWMSAWLGLLAVSLIGATAPAPAAEGLPGGVAISRSGSSGDDFVSPDVAFQVTAEATAPDRIEVDFRVLKGYYLYRDKMRFQLAGGAQAGLGKPALPAGETKTDEYFRRAGGLSPRRQRAGPGHAQPNAQRSPFRSR